MLKRTKTNLILHGIILLAVALFCLLTPQKTLEALAWILGVIFILGGVLTFFLGRKGQESGVDAMHLIASILMAAVGVIIIVRPNIIAILVGLVVLLEGIDFALQAVRYRKAGARQWGALLAVGILSIILGLWAVLSPWVGATMLSIIIGVGCLCVSADCFMALASIGRVERAIGKVRDAIADSQRLDNAVEVKE